VEIATNSALRRLFAAQDEESDRFASEALEEAIDLLIRNYSVDTNKKRI
jgi:hypothetical protein